jgi:thioredoxin-related protein
MMQNVNGGSTSIEKSMLKNGVLIMFSCNTCPYVIRNQQRTRNIAAYALQNNIGVIVINSNEAQRKDVDSYSAMQAYSKQQAYDFPYVVDTNSKLADAYGASHTPEIFLVNNEGRIVYKGAIDDNPADAGKVKREFLKEAINDVVGNTPILVKETRGIGCSIKRIR